LYALAKHGQGPKTEMQFLEKRSSFQFVVVFWNYHKTVYISCAFSALILGKLTTAQTQPNDPAEQPARKPTTSQPGESTTWPKTNRRHHRQNTRTAEAAVVVEVGGAWGYGTLDTLT